MNRKRTRITAAALAFLFTVSLAPVSLLAAENVAGGMTVDATVGQPGNAPVNTTSGDGSRGSHIGGGVNQYPNQGGFVDPNDPYGYGNRNRRSNRIPMLIGAAVGGLFGSHFGIVGSLAGAVAGALLGNLVGNQLDEPAYGNYQDNYNHRLDQYYSDYYGRVGDGQARLGVMPGIAGGVFGALLGSQIGGTLGLVAGGIGGFVVGQVFARVLFPQQYYDNQLYGGNYPYDNFRNLPPQFQSPNQTVPGTGYRPGYPGVVPAYPNYPPTGSRLTRGSETGTQTGDLSTLRANFFKSVENYQDVLKTGTNADKLEAREAFQKARDSYYRKKAQQ